MIAVKDSSPMAREIVFDVSSAVQDSDIPSDVNGEIPA
jgi:hypothetical protein